MRKIITLFITLATVTAQAQISIDSSDLGAIGDNVIMVYDSTVVGKTVAPPSATVQTFDYTGVSFSSVDTISFLNPTGTIGGTAFPNSNLLISRNGGAELIYANKSQTAIDLLGIYGDPYGIGAIGAIYFTPNVLLAPFPLDYGDTYSSIQVIDTVILDTLTGLFDSLRVRRHTSITSVVDAFGTLNLPNASADVLRKYDVEVTTDSLWGQVFGLWQNIQNTMVTEHYYRFIAKNRSYYLLEAQTDPSGNVLNVDYQIGASLMVGISNHNNVRCYGEANGEAEATAVGGVTPYQYVWSNGSVMANIDGLTVGTYTVTVTDAVSAMVSLNVVITEPDSIDIISTQIGADHGFSDGFIDIDVTGGRPSYAYLWSNGATTQNINNLDFGTYTVTVTDNYGCINQNSFEIEDITSVQDIFESDQISIYPNPSTGIVNLDIQDSWEVSIFTIDGKLIRQQTGRGRQTFDLTKREAGFYVIRIAVGEDVYQGKIQVL